jgi:hypothetical protein
MSCKWSINPFTKSNPIYSHTYYVTICCFEMCILFIKYIVNYNSWTYFSTFIILHNANNNSNNDGLYLVFHLCVFGEHQKPACFMFLVWYSIRSLTSFQTVLQGVKTFLAFYQSQISLLFLQESTTGSYSEWDGSIPTSIPYFCKPMLTSSHLWQDLQCVLFTSGFSTIILCTFLHLCMLYAPPFAFLIWSE